MDGRPGGWHDGEVKLLIVIVQDADADPVAAALRDEGHRFTRLASSGGFLGTPNTTLILAVEDVAVADVVDVIRANCSMREVELPLVLSERLSDWRQRAVTYGGATILVSDLAEVIRA